MAFNKVILLGNLTADPEVRTTANGQNLASFSLAVSRTFKGSDGERREETSFINCTAWGVTGETIAKYVGKGRQLLVSGRLQQRSWDDKETGKRRSAIDVVVEEFSFVNDRSGLSAGGSNNDNAVSTANDSSAGSVSAADLDNPVDLSDIPF